MAALIVSNHRPVDVQPVRFGKWMIDKVDKCQR